MSPRILFVYSRQECMNGDPWAKSRPLPTAINKVLFTHSQATAAELSCDNRDLRAHRASTFYFYGFKRQNQTLTSLWMNFYGANCIPCGVAGLMDGAVFTPERKNKETLRITSSRPGPAQSILLKTHRSGVRGTGPASCAAPPGFRPSVSGISRAIWPKLAQ